MKSRHINYSCNSLAASCCFTKFRLKQFHTAAVGELLACLEYARFTFSSIFRRNLFHRRIVGSGFVNHALRNTPCHFS